MSQKLLSQFLGTSLLSKVYSYRLEGSGKDGNRLMQGIENTADAEGPRIRAFGVRLVQHGA